MTSFYLHQLLSRSLFYQVWLPELNWIFIKNNIMKWCKPFYAEIPDLTNTKWSTYSAIDGVGSCQDAAAGVQSSVDASLGDGDAALFHDLMDSSAIHIWHLVKLINADHTAIPQNHGTSLETPLTWETDTT